ncbi:hypothetical protein [Aureibacter tunicatorum]|uniref:Uncharacterized protein n=1 Tax=Aureibacter tunicatorum TaxID=866807 RepID=A0AAE4BUN7_9BACT|nr:hypothetical protein [Aureibacter tunicatorum]MDR6241961.1 hypothetical protein [Aureibacter tunicatorum]BDD07514.1 hypothetical protein AUTU_49970 [Aureibacter tunicatorum]
MKYKKITSLQNQTLIDISQQEYGDPTGAFVLLEDNPALEEESIYQDILNFDQELDDLSQQTIAQQMTYLTARLPYGIEIKIRENYILNEEALTTSELFKENNISIKTN